MLYLRSGEVPERVSRWHHFSVIPRQGSGDGRKLIEWNEGRLLVRSKAPEHGKRHPIDLLSSCFHEESTGKVQQYNTAFEVALMDSLIEFGHIKVVLFTIFHTKFVPAMSSTSTLDHIHSSSIPGDDLYFREHVAIGWISGHKSCPLKQNASPKPTLPLRSTSLVHQSGSSALPLQTNFA